jgi:hypothetical protein
MGKTVVIACLLLLFVFAPFATIQRVSADLPAPSFYFQPSSRTYYTFDPPNNNDFTETLYVATTGDTFAYQYEVDYDPTVLNCISASYTSPPTSQFFEGHMTVTAGPDLSTPGKISGNETLLGTDVVHANTTGASIITMTFNILRVPTIINPTLTSVISLSSINTFLLDPNLNTVPNVSLGNVTFTYQFSLGPAPCMLTVYPQIQTFASTNFWNGTVFSEDMVILQPGALANATTQLDYNNFLTNVTSVTFDPIWATSSWSEIVPGTLLLNVSNPTSVPPSTVRIATINFTIIGQHSVPPEPFGYSDVSTLHLHDFQLGSTDPDIGYYLFIIEEDGMVTVFPVAHDIAVTNVVTSKTIIGQGCSLNVNVTAANQGAYTETLNLTVYANTTYLTSQNVTLSSGDSITINFTWNTTGFVYGNYTMSAYAWPVPSETYTANNNCTGGWVIVSMVGDVTGPNGWPDGKVDIRDVNYIAKLYGTTPSSQNWNPNADINGDGKVDIRDVHIAAVNYGQ